MKNWQRNSFLAMIGILMCGCATNVAKPALKEPMRSTVSFHEFSTVEMKPASLSDKDAAFDANQTAKVKIDENLLTEMTKVFPNLKHVETFTAGNEKTLQISPAIKEIKFIDTAARIWAGGFAGDSAVLMQVEYKDGSNGAVVANPEFYQSANAAGAAWTFGASDKIILQNLAEDIAAYSKANQ